MKLDDLRDESCAWCGRPFEGKRYDQRFCCKTCKNAFHDRERNAARSEELRQARSGYVCPECGEPFDATRVNQIYCSKRCKTREMLRRYRARLGEEAFLAQRREASRLYKRRVRAQKGISPSSIRPEP